MSSKTKTFTPEKDAIASGEEGTMDQSNKNGKTVGSKKPRPWEKERRYHDLFIIVRNEQQPFATKNVPKLSVGVRNESAEFDLNKLPLPDRDDFITERIPC